jgi:hypothetical protein
MVEGGIVLDIFFQAITISPSCQFRNNRTQQAASQGGWDEWLALGWGGGGVHLDGYDT